MLYSSDINSLLSQWETNMEGQTPDYKDAVRDCIYDLRCLMDKNFLDEAESSDSFEQQLKMDEDKWNSYFNSLFEDGLFA